MRWATESDEDKSPSRYRNIIFLCFAGIRTTRWVSSCLFACWLCFVCLMCAFDLCVAWRAYTMIDWKSFSRWWKCDIWVLPRHAFGGYMVIFWQTNKINIRCITKPFIGLIIIIIIECTDGRLVIGTNANVCLVRTDSARVCDLENHHSKKEGFHVSVHATCICIPGKHIHFACIRTNSAACMQITTALRYQRLTSRTNVYLKQWPCILR